MKKNEGASAQILSFDLEYRKIGKWKIRGKGQRQQGKNNKKSGKAGERQRGKKDKGKRTNRKKWEEEKRKNGIGE